MIYYILVGIVIARLIFDAFLETLINGTGFFRAFKVKWSDRYNNLFFNSILKKYNKKIKNQGEYFNCYKQIYDYFEYDEYVTLQIYKQNKVVDLEYSFTNNSVSSKVVDLPTLKQDDSYCGRWLRSYLSSLKKAQKFDGDYVKQIDKMIETYPEAQHKREQMISRLETVLVD